MAFIYINIRLINDNIFIIIGRTRRRVLKYSSIFPSVWKGSWIGSEETYAAIGQEVAEDGEHWLFFAFSLPSGVSGLCSFIVDCFSPIGSFSSFRLPNDRVDFCFWDDLWINDVELYVVSCQVRASEKRICLSVIPARCPAHRSRPQVKALYFCVENFIVCDSVLTRVIICEGEKTNFFIEKHCDS